MKHNLSQFSSFKCEVYYGNNITPYHTSYSSTVNTFIHDFCCWVDFPTTEVFLRMFVTNKQSVFEKLYLDDKGNIITRFVFTITNEGE